MTDDSGARTVIVRGPADLEAPIAGIADELSEPRELKLHSRGGLKSINHRVQAGPRAFGEKASRPIPPAHCWWLDGMRQPDLACDGRASPTALMCDRDTAARRLQMGGGLRSVKPRWCQYG
jgi:hypothetical protein